MRTLIYYDQAGGRYLNSLPIGKSIDGICFEKSLSKYMYYGKNDAKLKKINGLGKMITK